MLIWDQPERVNSWIGDRNGGRAFPGSYQALGWERDGRLVGGLAFVASNGRNCFVNIALENKVFPPGLLKAGLRYSFEQLKLLRLTFCVDSENIASQTLVRNLGAIHEATLQDAGNPGDMLIFALFPENCNIWRKINGQRRQCSPSS